MESRDTDVALGTLDLLEWRLRRIEFVLSGDVSDATQKHQELPALKRLQRLEDSLTRLSKEAGPVQELLRLYSRLPELFQTSTASAADDLQPDEKLAMVQAAAPLFNETASQLSSLNDVPLPDLKAFASLVALQPRIAQVERRQLEQAQEISELRKRSALLVLRWHENFVLGQGKCWVEWDSRMKQAERSVRREEVRLSD